MPAKKKIDYFAVQFDVFKDVELHATPSRYNEKVGAMMYRLWIDQKFTTEVLNHISGLFYLLVEGGTPVTPAKFRQVIGQLAAQYQQENVERSAEIFSDEKTKIEE